MTVLTTTGPGRHDGNYSLNSSCPGPLEERRAIGLGETGDCRCGGAPGDGGEDLRGHCGPQGKWLGRRGGNSPLCKGLTTPNGPLCPPSPFPWTCLWTSSILHHCPEITPNSSHGCWLPPHPFPWADTSLLPTLGDGHPSSRDSGTQVPANQ